MVNAEERVWERKEETLTRYWIDVNKVDTKREDT